MPGGLISPIAVWDFAPAGGLVFDSAALTFRYDGVAAGIGEPKLRLFHYSGGQWLLVPSTLDMANDRLSATVSSFSYFAIDRIPEPATLTILGLGALVLRRRRG